MKNAQLIIETAKTYKKIQGLDAQLKILEIAENIDSDDTIMLNKLAEIYRYFETKVTRPKTVENWVTMARSTDRTRLVLQHAYVENGEIVATDGRRLHVAKTTLPDGLYIVSGLTLEKVESDLTFPNYRQVVPEIPETEEYELDISKGVIEPEKHDTVTNKIGPTTIVFHHKGIKIRLNKKYFDEIMAHPEAKQIKAYALEYKMPVVFRFPGSMALLIPCRNED